MSNRILPEMIFLQDHGGDYASYIDAVYAIFEADFVKSKPVFRGRRLGLKHHPEFQGRAYTFYHMTHTGEDEANRTPDMRRCERISWAKPSIEKGEAWSLKIWPQVRRGKKRICIWLQMEGEPDYIVILDVREKYILPWTAFVIEREHEKVKKQKEYQEYLNAKTA